MKRLLFLLGCLSVMLCTSCSDSYDDKEIKQDLATLAARIEAVQQALTPINQDLASYAQLVEVLKGTKYILSVSESGGVVTITFNDHSTITLSSGAKGDKGEQGDRGESGSMGEVVMPQLKIDPTDGLWYISYDGETWVQIVDETGNPIVGVGSEGEDGATGATGTIPQLGVDQSGYWTIDYGTGAVRLTDTKGNPVVADPSKVPAGYFTQIELMDDRLEVTLTTGEVLSLPIGAELLFEVTFAEKEEFNAGEQRSFPLTQRGVAEIAIERPAGWVVKVEETAVVVTAPQGASAGTLTIYAASAGGLLRVVTTRVATTISTTAGDVNTTQLYGYGAATTGGAGATAANTHHFNSGTAFRDWLKLREKNKSTTPAIVWLSGTFTAADGRDSGSPWFDIKRTSNITIYGTDSFRMKNVGFFLNEAQNIILRNIYIVMPKADNGADGISMQESKNVWVDHCTFESVNQEKDYEDGSCDITHATSGVTVSWCHFIKTQKSSLVGHSNSNTEDKAITATFHHNFFDGSSSRHPRVRFGRVHVYNNFYNGCTTYGVGSAYEAMVLVEHNCFDGVRLPTDICTFPAKKSGSSWVSNLTGSVAGFLYAENNELLNRPSDATDPYPMTNVEYKAYNGEKLATPYVYADFKPDYAYDFNPASEVAAVVRAGAGVGKMSGYAEAPYAADNGTGQK